MYIQRQVLSGKSFKFYGIVTEQILSFSMLAWSHYLFENMYLLNLCVEWDRSELGEVKVFEAIAKRSRQGEGKDVTGNVPKWLFSIHSATPRAICSVLNCGIYDND